MQRALTAAELIELLRILPQDMEVWVAVEGRYIREGITGLDRITDGHIVLDTTGN